MIIFEMSCIEPTMEEIDDFVRKVGNPVVYTLLFAPKVLSCRNFGSINCSFNIVKNRNACSTCSYKVLLSLSEVSGR